MLDYDGTLAPFVETRMDARPHPVALAHARAIAAGGTPVAIVSGRPVQELQTLLGTDWAALVGEHGWEWREPGGLLQRAPFAGAEAAALDDAAQRAHALGEDGRVERKRTAVVLHVRGTPPDEARERRARLARAWAPLVSPGVLALDHTDGGLELRAVARHKGIAVAERLAREPAGTFAVYVGDDITDEDAFAAVAPHGWSIRVGDAGDGTRARAHLPDVEAVAAFLAEWRRVTGHAD